MEGPSGAAEAVNPRPRAVGHPSGSPEVEVVSSSSGAGATPTGSKVLKALTGKEPAEAAKSPDHPPIVRDLCEVRDRTRKDRYFITQVSDLPRLDAEGPLKPHWLNLTNRLGLDRGANRRRVCAGGIASVPR
ncbi:hypothetical protein GW17_00028651 [Ensete ventricosum]|nr:hypothetical protein GW17_00028651 [Ensete ventricosum]